MEYLKNFVFITIIACSLLHDVDAFVRVGRSESRKKNDNEWLMRKETTRGSREYSNALLKARVLKQLAWVKAMIDADDNGDADLYLFVAKSRQRKKELQKTRQEDTLSSARD